VELTEKQIYLKNYYQEHRESLILQANKYQSANREAGRARSFEIKIEVLTHYGKDGQLKCCWPDCNITDIDMLSLDHINNDGAGHRKEISTGKRPIQGNAFYRKTIKLGYPEGLQTLCCNHQMKKEIIRRKELRKVW
jgi:hypothetical protein